jgi:hypothetical protein
VIELRKMQKAQRGFSQLFILYSRRLGAGQVKKRPPCKDDGLLWLESAINQLGRYFESKSVGITFTERILFAGSNAYFFAEPCLPHGVIRHPHPSSTFYVARR